jgi:hypothetical protein
MKIPDDQGVLLRDSLRELGRLWGLRRDVRYSELGRALRLGPEKPESTVMNWAHHRTAMPALATVAIDMMLLGALPPDGLHAILTGPAAKRPDRHGLRIGEKSRKPEGFKPEASV